MASSSSLGDNPGGSVAVEGTSSAAARAKFWWYRGDHVARVRFALRDASSRSVLDFGCGPGLATFFLPPWVERYRGVELDEGPLAWARQHAPGAGDRCSFQSPTEFRAAPPPPCDTVLLLEVIEHVSDPLGLLRELMGHLRPGGTLVVSTPNGALSHHDPRLFQSPYHVTEFDPVEFAELIDGLGQERRLFEQHRVDRADLLPQSAQRVFRPALPPGSVPPAAATTAGRRGGASRMYRLWERLPQPQGLWRIRAYPRPVATDRGFSHLIALIRRSGAG